MSDPTKFKVETRYLQVVTDDTDFWRRHPEPLMFVGPFCRRPIQNDALLMRIMACRACNSFSRYKRNSNLQFLFLFLDELDHRYWRLFEEVICKELRVRHRGMAAPAEESDVRPESDISCPVLCRVRFYGMAKETNRLAVNLQDHACFIQHDMWIDIRILVFRMTVKADLSHISIGTSPQEVCTPSGMVLMVASQTLDLSVIKRERIVLRIGGSNIDRMVVIPVLMAVKAFR